MSGQGDFGAKRTPTPCFIAVPPENRWRPRLGTLMNGRRMGRATLWRSETLTLRAPMAVPWSCPLPATSMMRGGSILVCSIMLPVMSGSSLGPRKWLDAPVSTVMLKRIGSGLVWDDRNEKPTPDGGMQRAVAEPADVVQQGCMRRPWW